MNAWARRRARRALVQAIYQWQLGGQPADAIRTQFADNGALDRADAEFFDACLRGVLDGAPELDAAFAAYLDRSVAALDQVERAILRAGAYELRSRVDVPYKVAIDEYVRLAKTFGAEDSYKYVNGILDRVARDLRATETSWTSSP